MNPSDLARRARSALLALPLAIAACSAQDDGVFGETDRGSIIYDGEFNCVLAFPATAGSLILTVPKAVGPLEISVEGNGIGVDLEAETAQFGFTIVRTDGTKEEILQDSIHYLRLDDSSLFTADAPGWLVSDLARIAAIGFQWEGAVATEAAAPDGWAEEATMLSDCLGKPLAAVTPLED